MELSFDQLEEGEIRDDGFEDISDDSESVDLTPRGKFDSTNESLRALSLSSVSADDDTGKITKNTRYYQTQHRHAHDHDRHKKLHHHHHHRHYRKKRVCSLKRKASHSSSSSDEDADLDGELRIKLKEAVRIECSEKRNSLQTRLYKLMQKEPEFEAEPEQEQNKEQPEPLAQIRDNLQTTQEIINSDKIDDSDLEALRLEALKTAMLNKYQIRKKKKLEALQAAQVVPDKENEPEEPVAAQEPDEDLDALRANLLANLKKKAPSPKKPMTAALPPPLVPRVAKVIKQFKTQVIVNNTTKKINKIRPLPIPCVVAPLIISLRDDSDSDEPLSKTLPTVKPPATIEPDMSRIDQLLAESRARAEAMQQAEAETAAAATPPQKLSSAAPKSAMKLLPKSRQIEYHQLLRKLKTAEERKKRITAKARAQITKKIHPVPPPPPPQPVERVQAVEPETVPVQNGIVDAPNGTEETNGVTEATNIDNSVEKSVDNKVTAEEATPKMIEFTVERVIEEENKKSGVLKDVAILHGLLKEIRTNRNGRLQMRGKYQVLTPVVKKIMNVNNERKRHEAQIKDLMNELIELRRYLANTHEKFTTLVSELAHRKRSVDVTKVESKIAAAGATTTTTPLRNKLEELPVVTSTPMVPAIHILTPNAINSQVENGMPKINILTPSAINSQVEDMDVCNSEDNSDVTCHYIDIMDPNDIDQIFPRRQLPRHSNDFPEYVSPLNNCGRYNFVDPQGVMCPFELAGFCRDTECTFKHYLMR